MSKILGRNIEFGVAVEANRGTAETTADKWVKKITADVIEKADKKLDENTIGVMEDGQDMKIVRKWIEGSLEMNAHIDVLGYFFQNIYGASTPTDLSDGVYSHAFAYSQSVSHPTLSLFMKDSEQLVFNGGVINQLEIDAMPDDFVKVKADFLAKASATNSDTVSYDTEHGFIGRDVNVYFADTEAGLTGATAIKCKGLKLTFSNGAITNNVVGSLTPDNIYNGAFGIEGSFDIDFEDETYKDLFLADSYKYMKIAIIGADDIADEIGSSTTRYASFILTLNKVAITGWERKDESDNIVVQPVSFKALYNETDSEMSTLTIINNTASY